MNFEIIINCGSDVYFVHLCSRLKHDVRSKTITLPLDPPKNFSFSSQEWPTWKAHFARYRAASSLAKLDEESQINALIYIMGLKQKEIFKNFVFENGDDKKYDTVLAKIDSHFVHLRNIIHERFPFNNRCQKKGELAEEFITALHTLTETCEFSTFKDELIGDRFVVGIVDPKLRNQLQLSSGLALQNAI